MLPTGMSATRAFVATLIAVTEAEFVKLRRERDAKLSMPALILPSVQVNMRGGHLPEPEVNGTRYLKIPLDAL